MATTDPPAGAPEAPRTSRGSRLARTLAAAAVLVLVVWLLQRSLVFLKDPIGPERLVAGILDLLGLDASADGLRQRGMTALSSKLVVTGVALAVGVGGVWALMISANILITRFGWRWGERLRPYVFIAPAVAVLGVFLIYPVISTVITSLTEDGGALDNYRFAFTDPGMRAAFRNNVLWLVLGTGGSVVIGLLFAALVDRVKREAFAKTFIFFPLAISMVGAAVIWKFIYAWRPPGEQQIGLINAVVSGVGSEPVAWLQTPPINTLALIIIMVWLQTGFAMVVLSAALKGVSVDLIDAARVDGATERQLFFLVIIPAIRGSILTVATAVFIAILKVFDVVFVMTGGRFDTEVVANRMFSEMFRFRNFGRASALAVVLLIVVIPFIVWNIRRLRHEGIGS